MKILIPSVIVPFTFGGANFHIQNLSDALKAHGHTTQILQLPFSYSSIDYLDRLVEFVQTSFDHFQADKMIALQFPTYYISYHNTTIWLMHQHRAVYDLFDKNQNYSKQFLALRSKIIDLDNKYLKNNIFANSQNVANRLKRYNNISSTVLYHPPADYDKFYTAPAQDYIFFPSRLETLKRQDLLIKAMQYTTSPTKLIIAGTGGAYNTYQNLINTLSLNHKIKLIGNITQKEKFALFANSLVIAFTPYDEDYGYVSLEAMLSAKPTITCIDSGGVLEFIKHEQTGFVLEPDPKEIAKSIDWIYYNKSKAKEIGENAKEYYLSQNISWSNVVQKLLSV